MITAINGSLDLAEILNSQPLTEADAADTPRDWGSIWVGGVEYPLSQETTDTLVVLADGTAAVRYSPPGERCWGEHHRTVVEAESGHWCPADLELWTRDDEACGVERDCRKVYVWDANGFCETYVHPSIEAAREAFQQAVAELCD